MGNKPGIDPVLLTALLTDELDRRSTEPLTEEKRAKNKAAASAFVMLKSSVIDAAINKETARATKTNSFVDLDLIVGALVGPLLDSVDPDDFQAPYNSYPTD